MSRFAVFLAGFAVVLASVAVASSGGGTQADAHWVVTDLGTLGRGHWGSFATAINDRGQIVGMSVNEEALFQYGGHAFLWQNGKMRDLRAIRGLPQSWATGINNRGQVVGSCFTIDDDGRLGESRAILWEKGRIRTLATPRNGSSEAFAINEAGDVVGWAGDDSYSYGANSPYGVLWQQDAMRNLGAGEESLATGLNEHAHVVGISGSIDPNGLWYDLHGFVWEKGKTRSFGRLGGQGWRDEHDNWINAINDKGVVVGGQRGHATVWTNGVPHELAGIRGEPRQRSDADGINERGQIVGKWSRTPDSASRGALWEQGKLTLLPNLPGRTSSGAVAINGKGQIVGWAETKSGDYHAVLWTLRRS